MAVDAVKLEDIMGRPVSLAESRDVADYLLACLAHVTNARPLFGVFCTRTGLLKWTAGGADFHDVLKPFVLGEALMEQAGDVSQIVELISAFGISRTDLNAILEDVENLSSGALMTVLKPLAGAGNKFYRMVLRRRFEPNEHEIQFTLMDITAFQEAAARTQSMATTLVADLDKPHKGRVSARQELQSVLGDLQRLFTVDNEAEIATLAQDMSMRVTSVSERMVGMLLTFEDCYETGHWQPYAQDPRLRPMIATHSAPVQDWHELHDDVLRTVDGVPAIDADIAAQMRHAVSFVQHATGTLVIAPGEGRIFVLNGPAAERQFETVDEFVRAIKVEENSTRTATEFFSNLNAEPALAVFALDGENVEAWGRPGLYDGWQATLMAGMGQGVDVRGLFHGLKNLLLHLQVLYVVNTCADVEQVQAGLTDTANKIERRLADLDAVAKTGQRAYKYAQESVSQWLCAAKRVGVEIGEKIGGEVVVANDGVDHKVFTTAPSEMEDTFEELVRNAFQHGAKSVHVGAMEQGDHLCMRIIDDGFGMADDKLSQVQKVLKSRVYDPNLTTRKDGTGNGLLAAANAVSRFVDGQLMVDHGPEGRGVKISISMKLPA